MSSVIGTLEVSVPSSWSIMFNVDRDLPPGQSTITIAFPEGVALPETIQNSRVAVGPTNGPIIPITTNPELFPSARTVVLTVPDRTPSGGPVLAKDQIRANDMVSVVFTTLAGIRNPLSAELAGNLNIGLDVEIRVNDVVAIPPTKPTLRGRLVYNNEPITRYTQKQPTFKVRPRASGQPCGASSEPWQVVLLSSFDKETGEYLLDELAEGDYCLLPSIDAAAPFNPFIPLAGDYISGSGFGTKISVVARRETILDLHFVKFIHLMEPFDNSSPFLPSPDTEQRFVTSPFNVKWEGLPVATTYSLSIYTCEGEGPPCQTVAQLIGETLQNPETQISLPPNKSGEQYFLFITAMNERNRVVSNFWTLYGTSRNSGLYFKINP